jgi:hypothetical protein
MGIKTNIFLYHGRSMWPCFQEGDLLECEPCTFADIRVGDCVVYSTDDNKHVTHRVVAKRDYLTTRGDAMPAVDNEIITSNQIAGKIVLRHRLGNISKVDGGFTGWLAGRFFYYAGRIDPQRKAIGGRVARGLRTISVVSLKPFWNRGRKRTLVSDEEQEVTFWMIGKKAIGKKSKDSDQWQIAWPWNIAVTIKEDQ